MTQEKATFELFSQHGIFEAYEYFEDDAATRASEKEKFLANKIKNPILLYPKLKDVDFFSRRDALQRIAEDNKGETLYQRLFIKKIEEKLKELNLMEAAKDGDMEVFLKSNTPVSKENFEQVVNEVRGEVSKYIHKVDDLGMVSRELLLKLPNIKVDHPQLSPTPELIQWVKREFDEQFAPLFQKISIDITADYDAEETKAFFQKALENINAKNEFEIVVVENSKTAISVSQEKKQVLLSKTRKVKGKKLVQLIGHEIGVHVQRRVRGEQTAFPLIGLGLEGYLTAEEGITTVWEQAVDGKVSSYGRPEAYLAIGCALGLDGRKRDFRETFEIVNLMYLFKSLKKGGTISEKSEKATSDAWNRCVRTFRGTDCSSGVAYTKDVCYRDGNIKIWKYMEEKYGLGENLPNLLCGKFDPTNKEHCELVAML